MIYKQKSGRFQPGTPAFSGMIVKKSYKTFFILS